LLVGGESKRGRDRGPLRAGEELCVSTQKKELGKREEWKKDWTKKAGQSERGDLHLSKSWFVHEKGPVGFGGARA